MTWGHKMKSMIAATRYRYQSTVYDASVNVFYSNILQSDNINDMSRVLSVE